MPSVDNRIVEAVFDNKQFEKGISESQNSLRLFDKAINDGGKGKAFENLSGIISGVGHSFSSLEEIAVGALRRMGEQALNAGQEIANALIIKPVSAGMSEYELKLNTINTIMNATGESAEVVTQKISTLDDYADKTIYSTNDMFTSIGKFTNAGVSLDDATVAMIGIANAAALAGADTSAATRAFYNLSEAASQGYLEYRDFRSINEAGIATQEWRQHMLDAAVAAGTLAEVGDGTYEVLTTNAAGTGFKGVISATKNFGQTLQYQWLTMDALLPVMKDYGDETTEVGAKSYKAAMEVRTFSMLMDTLAAGVETSWAKSFEIIFGELDDAKNLWRVVNKEAAGILARVNDARNTALEMWDDNGGRDAAIRAVSNLLAVVEKIAYYIKEAMQEFFPPITGQRLTEFSKKFDEFSEKFLDFFRRENSGEDLKSTFKGLFAVIDVGLQIIQAVGGALGDLIAYFLPGAADIVKFTGSVGEMLTAFAKSAREAELFEAILDVVVEAIKMVADGIRNAAQVVAAWGVQIWHNLEPIFQMIGDGLKSLYNQFKTQKFETPALESFAEVLNTIRDALIGLGNKVKEFFSGFTGVDIPDLNPFNDAVEESESLVDRLTGLWPRVKEFFSNFGTEMERLFPIIGPIKDLFESIWSVIYGFVENLGSDFSNMGVQDIIDLVNGVLLGGLIKSITDFIGQINSLGTAFGADGFLGGLTNTLSEVQKVLKGYEISIKAEAIFTIAKAIAALAGAIALLSLIDAEKLKGATIAITTLFVELSGSMLILDRAITNKNTFEENGPLVLLLLGISGAVGILSGVAVKLKGLNIEDVGTSLLAMVGMTANLMFVVQAMPSDKEFGIGKSLGLIAFVEVLDNLVDVVLELGSYVRKYLDVMIAGILGVGAIIGELILLSKFGNTKQLSAAGLLGTAAAIWVVIQGVEALAALPYESLFKGLSAVGIILGELIYFSSMAETQGAQIVAFGFALDLMTIALGGLTGVVFALSQLSYEALFKGLSSVLIMLAELVSMANMIQAGMGQLLAFAFAVDLIVIALGGLTGVIAILQTMKFEDIMKGLAGIAGMLISLGALMRFIGSMVINPMVPITVAAFAASIVAVSLALALLAQVPIMALAGAVGVLLGALAAFALISVGLAAAAPAMYTVAGAMAVFGVSAALFGLALLAASTAITGFAAITAGGALAAGVAIGSLMEGLAQAGHSIGESGAKLAVNFIAGFLDGLSGNMIGIFDIVESIGGIVINLFLGLIESIVRLIPGVGPPAADAIKGAMNEVSMTLNHGTKMGDGVQAFADNQILAPIEGTAGEIGPLGGDIKNNLLDGFMGASGMNLDGLVDADTQAMLETLQNGTIPAGAAGFDLSSSIGEGFGELIPGLSGTADTALRETYDVFDEQGNKIGEKAYTSSQMWNRMAAQGLVETAGDIDTALATQEQREYLYMAQKENNGREALRIAREVQFGQIRYLDDTGKALMDHEAVVRNTNKEIIGSYADSVQRFDAATGQWIDITDEWVREEIMSTDGMTRVFADTADDIDDSSVSAVGSIEDMTGGMSKYMKQLPPETREIMEQYNSELLDGTNQAEKDSGEGAKKITSAFIDPFEGMPPKMRAAEEKAMREFVAPIKDARREAIEAADGVNNGVVAALNGGSGSGLGIAGAGKRITNGYKNAGTNVVTSYADAINSASKDASNNAAKSVVTTAVDTAKEEAKKFFEVGEQGGEGIADGLLSKIEVLKTAAKNTVNSTIEAAKAAADINSPSKVSHDEVGVPIGEGIVGGVPDGAEANIVKVTDTAKFIMREGAQAAEEELPVWEVVGNEVADNFIYGIADRYPDMDDAGKEIAYSISDGLIDGSQAIDDAMAYYDFKDRIMEMNPNLDEDGFALMEEFGQGILAGEQSIADAMMQFNVLQDALVYKADQALDATEDEFKTWMDEMFPLMNDAGNDLGEYYVNALQNGMDLQQAQDSMTFQMETMFDSFNMTFAANGEEAISSFIKALETGYDDFDFFGNEAIQKIIQAVRRGEYDLDEAWKRAVKVMEAPMEDLAEKTAPKIANSTIGNFARTLSSVTNQRISKEAAALISKDTLYEFIKLEQGAEESGRQYSLRLAKGISAMYNVPLRDAKIIADEIIKLWNIEAEDADAPGEKTSKKYADGIKSEPSKTAAKSAASELGNAVNTELDGQAEKATTAGQKTGTNVGKGITEKVDAALEELVSVIKKAVNTIQSELDNSPLKVKVNTDEAMEGLAMVEQRAKEVYNAATSPLTDYERDKYKDAQWEPVAQLNPDLDNETPNVTITLDNGQIVKVTEAVADQMREDMAVAERIAAESAANVAKTNEQIANARSGSQSSSSTVNYNQTINSPKPVSRTEVYQDTKTLLAAARERNNIQYAANKARGLSA